MTVRRFFPMMAVATVCCGHLAADEPGTVLVYEVDKPEDTQSEVSMAEIDSLVAATGFARRLGIILDGHLHSAPAIQGTIRQRGVITGNFTRQEVEDLAAVLNAGALPLRIKRVKGSTLNLKR